MRKGFTLIEILVVIAIMAVLIIFTLGSFAGYRQQAVLKLTEENILSHISEAKLKGAQGKKGFSNNGTSQLVCFGVLLEKDQKGVTFLQWPYSAKDFYDANKQRQTGRCEEVEVSNDKVVKEFKPFQEDVTITGLFTDGEQESEVQVYMIFQPPQAKIKSSVEGKELRIVLKTPSEHESELRVDLLTGNGL